MFGLLAISSALHVPVEIAEDATRHAAQLGHWRIVRVNADPYAGLLRDRHHLLDEVRVVVPDLFSGELAAVSQRRFEDLAYPSSPSHLPDGRRGAGAPPRVRFPLG